MEVSTGFLVFFFEGPLIDHGADFVAVAVIAINGNLPATSDLRIYNQSKIRCLTSHRGLSVFSFHKK